ncbi:MAG TPA: DNA alkylation repair protein [Thermoanaerobaculia bacterium]|nr:DNA alkylation repair protein [Thermoanaerobaculia bacterium]
MHPEVKRIQSTLRPLGTPERAEGAKAYLKSDLEFLGVTVPDLRRAAKAWLREHPGLDRGRLLSLVEALWATRVHELRAFGVELLQHRQSWLEPADLDLLERLLRASRTWAFVDSIAIQIVGPLLERHPDLTKRLDLWIRDDDFWIRRSALLALLLPLRRADGDWDRFTRYADRLLAEKEFFIRKAIGWVLREVSKKRPERVVEYVAARPGRLSGLTLREAIKHLPEGERARLMRRK